MADAWGGSWGSPSAWGVSWGSPPVPAAEASAPAGVGYTDDGWNDSGGSGLLPASDDDEGVLLVRRPPFLRW